MSADERQVLLGLVGLDNGGGVASVARCVARALDEVPERVARTDHVLLLGDPKAPPPPPARGVQRFARGNQALFVAQLWRTFWARRHDLVLFDLLGPARCTQLRLPGFPPPRYAIFCHGVELERAHEDAGRHAALHGAWRLLANSQHTADSLRETFPDLAARVRAVPLCIDPELVEGWQAGAPDTPPPRARAVLIVGRMWVEEAYKGHDQLLEAWPRVRARFGDAELWIVGDGGDRARLEAKAKEAGLDACVRFLGHVSDDELADRYRRAAVFAMPSRKEGFGLVYAEAMWHGTPCLGSTADAAREVIADGRTGRLVPYGDVDAIAGVLCEMLGDEPALRALGEAAASEARARFGYARFASDLLRALELEA